MSEKAPGFEEYTPSRAEWLVVILNSHIHYINSIVVDHSAAYITGDDGKTIILKIRYPNDMPPERLKHIEDLYKMFAMDMAEKYKWDSWLEIQTDFDPFDPIEE